MSIMRFYTPENILKNTTIGRFWEIETLNAGSGLCTKFGFHTRVVDICSVPSKVVHLYDVV